MNELVTMAGASDDSLTCFWLCSQVMDPTELEALHTTEQEVSYNAALAAMRLEKLLEKGVPLSDELVLGCQRGDPSLMNELDYLVRSNLSASEVRGAPNGTTPTGPCHTLHMDMDNMRIPHST